MIILFSSSLGLMAVKRKKEQLEYVKTLIYMGSRILILLKSTMPETDEIMRILKNDEALAKFDFTSDDTKNRLNPEDRGKVTNLFNSIGRYDIESQIYITEEFTEYFKLKKEQYQEYYNEHYRLYLVFGVFSGVIAAVLLV